MLFCSCVARIIFHVVPLLYPSVHRPVLFKFQKNSLGIMNGGPIFFSSDGAWRAVLQLWSPSRLCFTCIAGLVPGRGFSYCSILSPESPVLLFFTVNKIWGNYQEYTPPLKKMLIQRHFGVIFGKLKYQQMSTKPDIF